MRTIRYIKKVDFHLFFRHLSLLVNLKITHTYNKYSSSYDQKSRLKGLHLH